MTNINYLAGFFDGEGCISFGTTTNPNNNKIYFRSAIQAAQLVKEPLLLFQERYGGYIYFTKRPNKNPYYTWRLSSNKAALEFLKEIYPYLIVKHDRAVWMISVIETYLSKHIIPKTGKEDQVPPFSER